MHGLWEARVEQRASWEGKVSQRPKNFTRTLSIHSSCGLAEMIEIPTWEGPEKKVPER